ncbi:YbaN family protein [uncultured Spongiibacter sp.]|uniref:YbaN family protein n=1 Tax=uncultured Spongiibacter sp. TaxID=870896 RepID=UPI002585C0D5|nr:YbaN family protein [uncultured Spongiibacter sp.]
MKSPYEHRNPVIRYSLIAIGWLSFVLGMIGLLLPVVPTSPFLILSAACFLRSSPKFYQWLTEHPWFGVYIRYYIEGQGIPKKIKALIITVLWIMMLSSAFLIVRIPWVSAVLCSIAALVSIYILRHPTPDAEQSESE